MQELTFEQVEEVSGGFQGLDTPNYGNYGTLIPNAIGGAVGGAIGAVGGFFVGAARVAFSDNHTSSLSENFKNIGMSTLNGAWAGATVGSGAGLVGGAISAGAALITNEIVSEASN